MNRLLNRIGHLGRLPIRVKLTLIFAGAMSVLLVLIGTVLLYRTKANLDDAIRQSLRARSGNLQSFAAAAPQRKLDGIEPGEDHAQLLSRDGRVIASRPPDAHPLLHRRELDEAINGGGFIERPERARLLTAPTRFHGEAVIAVVRASLAEREHTLESLARSLLVGGPIALLIASGIGYALATAALRPVESMRRRAEGIRRAEPNARLPVPDADDEVRRLGDTLNDMLARLDAAAAHERSFVANASHELRTPLTTLRAELEIALRRHGSDPGYRETLGHAIEQADRLARLADDLLILARTADGLPAHRSTTALRPLLSSVVDEFRNRPETADRDITIAAGDDTVIGDESSIRRAFLNLIDNALVHGGGDVAVAAQRASENTLAITVTDHGPPLDAAVIDSAFERFVHQPRADGRVGSGLGLSIVRAVAEAHGGSAEIRNRPEGGVETRMVLRCETLGDRGQS